jgi:serine/threonine-protein kinase HipA
VIGNGDAHGKNDSLLHYSLAPSLAPLYDLLSTVVYEELTKRLAMSIDGAIKIEEVDGRAWSRLADEVGVSPRFLEQRMGAFVEQVVGSALALSENPEFAGPVAEGIVAGIAARAERFEQPGLNPGGPAPQRHTKERA